MATAKYYIIDTVLGHQLHHSSLILNRNRPINKMHHESWSVTTTGHYCQSVNDNPLQEKSN